MVRNKKDTDGKVVIQIDTSAKVDLSAYEKLNNLIEFPQQKILPEFSPHLLLPSDISLMPLPKRNIQHLQPNIVIHNCYEEEIEVENNGQMTFIEYVEKLDDYIKEAILDKFNALAKDEVSFTQAEWTLMNLIRNKPTIKNAELAKIMGYAERNIEEICAQIRKKMDFELIEDNKVKRNLLIQFILS